MRILGHKPFINTSYCTGHSLELKYFHFLQFLCFFFAQDSIRNMWFCSYVIFWLRKLKLKYRHMYCNQQRKWWQERNFEKCTLQQALSEVILMQLDLWRYIFSGSKRVPLCLCQGLKFNFYGFFFVLLDHTLLKQKYCSSIFSVWHAMHYVKLNKFSNQLILDIEASLSFQNVLWVTNSGKSSNLQASCSLQWQDDPVADPCRIKATHQ